MDSSNKNRSNVPLTDLLSESFFVTHTNFKNLNDFFIKAGYEIKSRKDIDSIPQEEIDLFVKKNTKFEDFRDLQKNAIFEYIRKKLSI